MRFDRRPFSGFDPFHLSGSPPRSPSLDFGVGSEDEQPGPAVAGANVARSYNAPLRIEPELGKVTEDDIESERKVACDVLQHDEPRS